MNNYDLILRNQLSIYLIGAFIGSIVVFSFRQRRAVASLVLINWQSVVGLSALIYLFLFSDTMFDHHLTLLVIEIELALLFIVIFLLRDLIFRIKSSIRDFASNRILIKLLIISTSVSLYLFVSNPERFGIFSEGSRIDYLSNGSLPLLLTYLSAVFQTALVIVIGSRIYTRKFCWLDIVALMLAFVTSLLSGSKGAIFLAILNMGVLAWGLGYSFRRVSLTLKLLVLTFSITAVGAYLFFMAKFLNFTFEQSINLALSRFVLTADARALASDSSIHSVLMSNTHGTLLAEIFKGFSRKLGVVVSEMPLGVAQYAAAYNIDSFVGANAGLSSFILSYYDSYADLLAIVFCVFFATVIISAAYMTLNASRRPFERLISLSFLFTILLTFVQDYQAFVQLAYLLFAWMIITFLRRLTIASVRHMPRSAYQR